LDEKIYLYLRSLLVSISNHIAKSVNWLELIKEKKAAKAFMGGMYPLSTQKYIMRINRKIVTMLKKNPRM